MRINHNYSKLWSLYNQVQNAKCQHINPVEVFNSRLHDSFMHMEINGADITGIYSRKGSTITIPEREITDAITDAVNFRNVNYPGGWPGDLLDSFEAFAATLPPVSPERATEIKAVNNHIDFQKGLYYKFTDENGKTRVLASTSENKLSLLETDVLAGRADGETKMIANFWSGLYWHAWRDIPASKQAEYLEVAGVQPGFFTFTAHDKTMELYFNPECKGYPLMDREEYDSYWRPFQNDNWCKKFCDPDGENWCEPGDIVEGNNGRQFVVNQDGKIDVQYGDDVLSLHPLKVIGHVDM